MHIVLVGPGALGCLLASQLIKGKGCGDDTIALLDYDRDRAVYLNGHGITYENSHGTEKYPIEVFSSPEPAGVADIVFLCVKSYDVPETLKFCAPLLRDGTLLIFVQNGMAHLQDDIVPGCATSVFGTTTEGATSLAPGWVRHAGNGITYFGFLQPQPPWAHRKLAWLVQLLTDGGMNVRQSDTIYQQIWTKLLINVGINALTVVHNCPNGELLALPVAKKQMEAAVSEATEVAAAEGIMISQPLQKVSAVCRSTATNISSMLQDIRLRRPTEIDAINGIVVQLAAKHGIAVPANRLLVDRVKEIEKAGM